mmetsp:Transcript_11232/g.31130  ORF Transcript_11232/g.31130 Transcript_11232/m.31130 type:complete len:202 (+) Transcript_11232:645-1250(+)
MSASVRPRNALRNAKADNDQVHQRRTRVLGSLRCLRCDAAPPSLATTPTPLTSHQSAPPCWQQHGGCGHRRCATAHPPPQRWQNAAHTTWKAEFATSATTGRSTPQSSSRPHLRSLHKRKAVRGSQPTRHPCELRTWTGALPRSGRLDRTALPNSVLLHVPVHHRPTVSKEAKLTMPLPCCWQGSWTQHTSPRDLLCGGSG